MDTSYWVSQSQQTGTDADDVLYVGKGNELIDGKAGYDVLNTYPHFTSSGLQFDSTKGLWSIANGSGRADLVDIEAIQFTGIKLELNEQTKRLVTDSYQSGTGASDALYMSTVTEVIDGKGGADVLDLSSYYYNNSWFNYAASGLAYDSTKGHWMVNHFQAGKQPVELIDVESIKFGDIEINLNDARLSQVTQHVSTDGDDNLIGNDLGYALYGGKGDDVFTGNGGDDILNGGMGKNVAVYRGSSSDYVVERNGTTGIITIQDLNANRDGTDTLWFIENLRFADGEFDINDLATLKPGTEPPPVVGDMETMPIVFAQIQPTVVQNTPGTSFDIIWDNLNSFAATTANLELVADFSFPVESQAFNLF